MGKDLYIEQLIHGFYGKFDGWEAPTLLPSKFPQTDEPFRKFTAQIELLKREAREALEAIDVEHLRNAVSFESTSSTQTNLELENIIFSISNEARTLSPPAWWAGGFAVEGKHLDYRHWVKFPTWDKAQTIALSMGVEPFEWAFINTSGGEMSVGFERCLYQRIGLVSATFFENSAARVRPLSYPPKFGH